MKKISILSHVLPPSPSGQSVMLYRILSGIDPSRYYLIASQPQEPGNSSFYLKGQQFNLPEEPALFLPIRRLQNIVNLFISIFVRAGRIFFLLRRTPTMILIACSGDLVNIPAAFLASHLAKVPFYAYIFDDYVFQWVENYRQFARFIAPFIFRHAAGIIGPNEFICDEYQHRYGVDTALVRNPCNKEELLKENNFPWPAKAGLIKIVYTGAVYHANYDCFRNLIRAMECLPEHNLELHIFTAQTSEQLADQEVEGKLVFVHSHVPYHQVLEEQRKADILFLPLAFESPIPEVIRTSAPGKLGEYLASGRPVLAHVPADSFVAYYLSLYKCGWVAEQSDVDQLASVIKTLVTNSKIRLEWIRNARRQASLDFSPETARDRFLAFLDNKAGVETAV